MGTTPTPAPAAEVQRTRARALTPRRALLASVVVILVVLGATIGLVLALGGGGNSELEAYFEQAEPVINDINERTEQGQYSNTRALLIHLAIVLIQSKDSLNAIAPPPEAAAAHKELASALEDEGITFTNLADQKIPVDSIEELGTYLAEHKDLIPIIDRVTKSCFELQQLADDNGIEVELELCSSGQPS